MADCRGRSGPLEDVLRAARQLGLEAGWEDLRSLQAHETRLAEVVKARRAEAEFEVSQEIANLASIVADGDPQDAQDRERVETETAAALERIERDIRRLEVQRGLLLRILNAFRLPSLRTRAGAWRRWRTSEVGRIDGRAEERRRRLERLRADPAIEVARRDRKSVV